MIGDKPAFPSMDMNSHMGVDRLELRYTGMTMREYFAAMAMQGILASSADRGENWVAEHSVKFADALLKQLDNGDKNG